MAREMWEGISRTRVTINYRSNPHPTGRKKGVYYLQLYLEEWYVVCSDASGESDGLCLREA